MPRVKRKGKKRLYLLGEGYPWYHGNDYDMVSLNNGLSGENFERYPLKTRWGNWQKVKIWIEKA